MGTVLHNEEFAIDFTYVMKKLLLTVVTLVSPLILTLVTINISVIWTNIVTANLQSDIHHQCLSNHLSYAKAFSSVSRQVHTVSDTVGFSVWPLCIAYLSISELIMVISLYKNLGFFNNSVLSGKVLHGSVLYSILEHGNFLHMVFHKVV